MAREEVEVEEPNTSQFPAGQGQITPVRYGRK